MLMGSGFPFPIYKISWMGIGRPDANYSPGLIEFFTERLLQLISKIMTDFLRVAGVKKSINIVGYAGCVFDELVPVLDKLI